MADFALPENQARAYLDAAGLHIPEYAAVLADLQNVFRAIYGEDVYLEADSQDGALCAVLALRFHDCFTMTQSVYNAFFPSTAQGTSLSSVVKVNGITRHNSSRSQVDLRLVGQAGTIIDNGAVEDERGKRWLLPGRAVIPLSGEITVTATAEETGDLRAAPGEINRIATPVRGWQSVSNPAAARPGAPVEEDYQLRRRQKISTATPSRTVFEGTRGGVAALPGVIRHQAYENDTGETDANGLPAHSICLVVEGGQAQAIAEAINARKTPGCGTYGDVAVPVVDVYGVPNTIRFFRAVILPLRAKARIRPLNGYLASTGEAMRQNLLACVNALDIGEDVLISKMYTPINAAEPDAGRRSFDVLEILVGPLDGALAQGNLEIDFKSAAAIALENIEIEVVSQS
jgi:uncharacterized phage protein gp47/JayE